MAENFEAEGHETEKGLRLLAGIVLAAVATFFLLYFLGFGGQAGKSVDMKVEGPSVGGTASDGT